MIEKLLLVGIVALAFFLIFKCRILGHVWRYYVYGRLCIWCNKVILNGEAK